MTEWLERDGANCQQHINAAAELRRLHAQRDALLAALQAVASQLRLYGEVKSGRAIEDIVNDAINKAEGQ